MATGAAFSFDMPPEEAIAFLEAKKPQLHFDYDEIMHAAHHKAFTVAKVVKLDLLSDIQESLVSAQKEGKSFEAWRKELLPTLGRHGWLGDVEVVNPETGEVKQIHVGSRRLRTIYDTNMRTSYAVGRYTSQMLSDAEYLRYSAILDARTRPKHTAMHGIILPKTHPWWETNYPPNGWRCRCKASSLTATQLKSRGLKVYDGEPPNIATRDWAYHPGKTDSLMEAYTQKLEALKQNCDDGKNARSNRPCMKKLYEAAIKETLISKDAFKSWFAEPKVAFLIASLHPTYKEVLGVESSEVPITQKVIIKQQKEHPDIEWYEYLLINTMLNSSDLVIKKGEDILIYIKPIFGKSYFCVVRANTNKEKAFIVSYRQTNSDDIEKEIKRGEVIWDKR